MLRDAWSEELGAAHDARQQHDFPNEWSHLERAHVLSQPMAGLHLKTHVAMLGCAVRQRNAHEAAGQLFRLLVAAPGSWTGRYPVGNTGGSDVSAFRPMPIPDDLAALLEGADAKGGDQ
jgi:hypothetical protein